ncbi:heme exporter protein CcmD [Psychrobacter aquaticus]|uniref:Heme exporter protein D n=1 Tax=Psychrobacter aquaticus CMS 56 TaxID=1354303 RepID=U4T521_9GAMM|nr:heme exporter protein CcmD [Psychrobacter aquaticus]ERL56005.1 Cytochrome c-type biogenesis protein CcmD, interacts with CcmCE [Psychrobacter aquaticus CMS 56]
MQPYFYSFSEFIAMGKHGVFVWSCWAITVGMMLVFILYSRRQRKALIKQLTIQQARQAQRTAKTQSPTDKRTD